MIDWTLYKNFCSTDKFAERDEEIKNVKSDFERMARGNPGYKKFFVDGITSVLVDSNDLQLLDSLDRTLLIKDPVEALVLASDNHYKKYINTLNKNISIGDVVIMDSTYWLVTSMDNTNNIILRGTLEQCNQRLRFQLADGTVAEQWCIIDDPFSRYSRAEPTVNINYSVLQCTVPYDENTRRLSIDMRLFLWDGYNKHGEKIPFIYKITNIKPKTLRYGDRKLIIFDLERSVTTSEDSVEEEIADYSPDKIITQRRTAINGGDFIRMGGFTRVLKAEFYGENDNIITNLTPLWNVEDNSDCIDYIIDGDLLKVKTKISPNFIGERIKITVSADGFPEAQKILEVI